MGSEPVNPDSLMGAETEPLQVVLDENEEDRYSRLALIPWWDQSLLTNSRVLVVGAGALGNEILKNLALLGVGRVHVVDMDLIESTNLSRSVLFREGDEGLPKAEVAACRAHELNSDVEVIPIVGDITSDVGLGLFMAANAVIGGLDNREARLFINQSCWKVGTPFIDGAIETLFGVARVFVPNLGACYECTMSEVDYQLLSNRRTCALLTRDEVEQGKIPTTPTVASIIAGVQVQEYIKLLHSDRDLPLLVGKGFFFNGLTHDSYTIEYPMRADCLSHDSYGPVQELPVSASGFPLSDALDWAEEALGAGAGIELERELVVGLSCPTCGTREPILTVLGRTRESEARCPVCTRMRIPEMIHFLDRGFPMQDKTLGELGVPPYEILTARAGMKRVHALLAADRHLVLEGKPEGTGSGRESVTGGHS